MYKIGETKLDKGRSILDIPASFVVFDLETTGLNPFTDEIIEIGAVKVIDHHVVDTFSMLVRPKSIISSFITNLTGITNEMVKDVSPIEEVLPLFLAFVDDFVLVGHNVPFDVNFIHNASIQLFQKPFGNDFVDTLRLSRILLKQLYRHKLGEIANYYGMDTTGSHRSLKDVEMTLAIFYQLQEEILNQYGSFSAFLKIHSYGSLPSRSIVNTKSTFDSTHPFYQKHVVITGTISEMTRKEARQILRNLGAFLDDAVTIRTDFLIVGSQKGNHKSTKLRMAERLQESGSRIEIITSSHFYEQIKEKI